MDAVTESINWSAIAADAFERKLLDLASRKKVGTMDEVIERLKAAAKIEENKEYQAGHKAGVRWAKANASPKELRRIADYIDGHQGDWADIDDSWNAPESFVFAMRPKWKADGIAADEFWEQALGDDGAQQIKDEDFLRGFGEGAMEIWEMVSHEI
jgi:hypothetical protein